MIPSPAIAPSSTDGLSTLHHPSSLHLSPYKSHVNPSIRKPVENSNTTGAAPPEFSNESAPKRRSPRVQGKRKRDSEPHFANGSQLREAQERVEQKRAKIAARVPSAMAPGNVNATPTPVTSLADLYAQMRRDSDAPSQRDAASISSPSPTTAAPWNGRILHRRPQDNAPVRGVGHSVASSPDPIAMSEDDQEVVMVKHVRPSSPQVRPRLEQAMRLGRALPHLNLKSLSQAAKPMALTSTPKSSATDGVDKLLDKTRKAKPSFAVVVPSPPKRLTLKPTSSVERNTPGRHTSQSKDSTQAGTPVPNHTEKLKEITNAEAPESSVTHIPSSAPVPLTRSIESIPESIPDYAPRRLRRGMGASEDLTARDIDTLLGAVPIPFDFSLSHRHLTTHHHHDDDKDDDGERRDEESSLWWHHPIFEARAKADIRRTLGALLPADPAQDPPPITSDDLGGGGSWRAEVLPRQSGARMWAERLEDAFGPGPLDRGMGRKPRRVARPAGAAKRDAGEGSLSKNGAVRMGAVVIVNSPRPAHGMLEPPCQLPPSSQAQVKSSNETADAVPLPPASVSLALVDAAAGTNMSDDEVVAAAAAAWTAALLPLVKGKTTMDGARIAQTSDALGEVERANQRGDLARDVLKESALADTVRRLGELESVPLGDVHGLRSRARTLAHGWREAFGDDVVDLQREALLHLTK